MKGLKTVLIHGELAVRHWLSLRNNSIGWGEVTIPKLKKFIAACEEVQTAVGEALFWAEQRLEKMVRAKLENDKKKK